ncbi:MAG: family transporter, partial [Chloroflexi bacterium]|nr:family transporter [Chloroflexota bacterium]
MPPLSSPPSPAAPAGGGRAPAGVLVAPPWLSHLAAISWRVLAIGGLAVVLVELAAILITVVASVLIAAIVAVAFLPLQDYFRGQRGWSPTRAAAAVWLIASGIIVAAIGLVAVAFVPEIAAIIRALADGLTALKEQFAQASIPPEAASDVEALANAVQGWIADGLATIAGLAGAVGTIAILSFFLAFFVLKDGERGIAWALQFVTGWRRDAIVASGAGAVDHLGGYLRGIAVLAAARAVVVLAFLLVLGIPLAGPLAAIVFLGGLVPYLGGLIAAALVVLIALASNGVATAALVLVLVVVASLVLDIVLAPRVYGTAQRMHPALALAALAVGAS